MTRDEREQRIREIFRNRSHQTDADLLVAIVDAWEADLWATTTALPAMAMSPAPVDFAMKMDPVPLPEPEMQLLPARGVDETTPLQ